MRETARPVMYRTGVNQAPMSTAGTCFLAGYRGRLFIITAAHVIGHAEPSQIVVCASDGTDMPMQIGNAYGVENLPDDEYEIDLKVFETSLAGLPKRDRENGRIIFLDKPGIAEWQSARFTAMFLLCGHPSEINGVDYELRMVQTNQAMLVGQYKDVGTQLNHHFLSVANPLGFKNFKGFSGSPVFSLEFRLGAEPNGRFCGIALTGSADNGLVQFLDSQIIIGVLDSVIDDYESLPLSKRFKQARLGGK